MSGIVAIVDLDGGRLDPQPLHSITSYLAHRGPDAQRVWCDGPAGLGHSLLRTTPESIAERQPFTLDGRSWITADCRVDGRGDLRRKLEGRGSHASIDAPDVELLLRAYGVWGEQCVDHILGDFSFAIWNGPERRLFCARDHLGVKPFFHARVGSTLLVCNDLNAIRVHPGVSNAPDALAIADFLLFNYALDTDRTSFAEIRRLPAAHTLVASGGEVCVRRYWDLPYEEEIRYRDRAEYVDHFRELLGVAVQDRLRTDRLSVMMSGGLDSPSLAATAKRVTRSSGSRCDVRAFTMVFDRIVPDEERAYSRIAADALGVPIVHYGLDDLGFPPRTPDPEWFSPEPGFLLDRGRIIDMYRAPVAHARVLWRGDGADPLIHAGSSVTRLFAAKQYGRLVREFLWMAWKRKQPPRMGLKSLLLRRIRGANPPEAVMPFPSSIAPALERQFDLRRRWGAWVGTEYVRPGFELACAYWPLFFETADPGPMRLPAEMRYPFADVRLVSYLLRVPPLPWGVQKCLLRIAMEDELPQAILRRSKAPLAGNPWASLVPPAKTCWWSPYLAPGHGLDAFIDIEAARRNLDVTLEEAQRTGARAHLDRLRIALTPVGLSMWLRETACVKFGPTSLLPEQVDKNEIHAEARA